MLRRRAARVVGPAGCAAPGGADDGFAVADFGGGGAPGAKHGAALASAAHVRRVRRATRNRVKPTSPASLIYDSTTAQTSRLMQSARYRTRPARATAARADTRARRASNFVGVIGRGNETRREDVERDARSGPSNAIAPKHCQLAPGHRPGESGGPGQ